MSYTIESMRLAVITTSSGVTVDLYRSVAHGGGEEYVRTAHGTSFNDAVLNLVPSAIALRAMDRAQDRVQEPVLVV